MPARNPGWAEVRGPARAVRGEQPMSLSLQAVAAPAILPRRARRLPEREYTISLSSFWLGCARGCGGAQAGAIVDVVAVLVLLAVDLPGCF